MNQARGLRIARKPKNSRTLSCRRLHWRKDTDNSIESHAAGCVGERLTLGRVSPVDSAPRETGRQGWRSETTTERKRSPMPDDDAIMTPLYDDQAQQASTPLPVSTNREHEVADISARTTSRLAIGMAAATMMAMAGTVAVHRRDSVRKTLGNFNEYDNDEYKFMDDTYKLLGDDLIQTNWPGLTCENTDDDSQDWPSGTACICGAHT